MGKGTWPAGSTTPGAGGRHPGGNRFEVQIRRPAGQRQAVRDGAGPGQKTSFCLVDVAPYDMTLPNAAPEASGFGCGTTQRISVGWEDIYEPLTVGQQIDVSGLAPGQYWLEAVVDPDNHLREAYSCELIRGI